jgi:N-acetylglutamate synthase-like GNAT family acetyltransferase
VSVIVTSRLSHLPAELPTMEREALDQGFGLVTRLRTDWESGINRFAGEGEILFVSFHHERLVGIAGLNRDPYGDDPRMGRLRHLYVMQRARDAGVGTSLVQHILEHANTNFDVVRVWTDRAAGFYERLGFVRVDGPKVTHVFWMKSDRAADGK